ncbi:MAG: hypothetical protein JST89_04360 [Cyanobacteria bacterium SZAS-4]|nr:hypothetical protein [Cyanobacteria bacterium SZAS-4]
MDLVLNALSKYLIATIGFYAATTSAFAADPAATAALTAAPVEQPSTQPQPRPNQEALPSLPRQEQPASAPPPDLSPMLERMSLPGWNPVPGAAQDANPDKTAMLKEFGCRTSVSKGFQRGQRRIDVVVYSFSSSQGAYAAYSLLRRGSSTFVTKGDASSEDDQSVSIWQDRYFISVSGTSEDDEESKLAISSVAKQLCDAIPVHGQLPLVVTRLPNLDRVRGSEKVVMGPISARRFFPAPSLNLLSLPNSYGGGIADYQFQAPFRERMKLLVVDYGNSTAAAQVYQRYVASIEEQHPNISPTDVESRALFKMVNSYLLCELRSQRIVLISGARKRSAPIMLARQVL